MESQNDFQRKMDAYMNYEHRILQVYNNLGSADTLHAIYNLVEYFDMVKSAKVRENIIRILKTGLNERDIDISNIEHYLIVADFANSRQTLLCCENRLIQDLRLTNCNDYNIIADRYKLKSLKKEIKALIHRALVADIHPTELQSCQAQVCLQNNKLKTIIQQPATVAKSDIAIITYRRKSSQQRVKLIVCDKDMRVKYCRNLKFDEDKYKLLRCCSLVCPADNSSYIFMCFGDSFYRYNTLSEELKKRSSLRCKRTGYCLITCANRCYVIGGEYHGRKVLEIEEFDNKKNEWRKVAGLPRECLPMQSSCTVNKDCVYIFCAMVDIANNIKKDRTGVYVFCPAKQSVEKFVEINFWFKQFNSCTLDSLIYIASNDGQFIRFSPEDGKVTKCKDQKVTCRDFGMYSGDKSIILIGGVHKDGTFNNTVRKFSTISETWEISSTSPAYNIQVYGVCKL